MSKIGRKPIDLGTVHVEVNGSQIHYKGKTDTGIYALPLNLKAEMLDKRLILSAASGLSADALDADVKQAWGLHRALLANKIMGADKKFEKILKIVGLGFKAVITGNKIQFSLGYSHKIDYELPEGVSAEVDKSGQVLTVRSIDKEMLGHVCSEIRAMRPPEPYKGTGIQYAGPIPEVIRRKAGKAK